MKILVFPKDNNPYQELLYSHMYGETKISYFQNIRKPKIINFLLTPFELLFYRFLDYKIIHLHWLFPFSFSNKNKIVMLMSEYYLWTFYITLRLLKYKFVWTIHDLVPHERTFIDDLKISKKLSMLSDAIIVLNTDTKRKIISDFRIQAQKVHYIPMGNFIDYYPENITHKKRTGFNFLYFGQIKEYKGVDDLIINFKLLKGKNLHLNIVGKCADRDYTIKLDKLIEGDKRINFEKDFIINELLASKFSQCDIVVLPFKRITNSSSAILAFSMRKPIISPRIAMINDFPISTGFYYNKSNKLALRDTMLEAIQRKDELLNMGLKAYEYAKSLNWKKISSKNRKLYSVLLSDK